MAQGFSWSRHDVQIRYVHWGVGELTVGQITVTAGWGSYALFAFITQESSLFPNTTSISGPFRQIFVIFSL